MKKIYNKNMVMGIMMLLPFVEVITTLTLTYTKINITLGMIIKTAFTLYATIYLLFVNKTDRKYNVPIIIGILAYCLINMFVTTPVITFKALCTKLVILSRYICFPFFVLFFYSYNKENKLSLKTVVYVSMFYGFFMFLAGVTDTALPSYASYGLEKGHSGWYNSGNEISNLLSMFLPIIIYYMARENKIITVLAFMLTNYGLLVVGTKTSLVGLMVITILTLIFSAIRYVALKEEMSKSMIQICALYLVFLSLIVPLTPAFRYMKERYTNAVDSATQDGETDASDVIDQFIYNGRATDLKEQLQIYNNSSLIEKLFGINDNTKLVTETGEFNVIERDFYDVLFIHGLVGIGIFFAPAIVLAIYFVKKLIQNFKLQTALYKLELIISLTLVVGISYIAGHVFLSSTVAIFVAFILSYLNIDEDNTRKVAIYMPKLSYGGMEQALLNMLNESKALRECEVDLILGYTTDKELLARIPEYVNLRLLCKGKWNKFGKLKAGINYVREILIALAVDYTTAICYSYHHKVLSVLSRIASDNTVLFMHTDLINSRTKEEIDKLNNNVQFEKFKNIICVSNAAKKSMNMLYPNYNGSMMVIYNYIAGDRLQALAGEALDTNITEKYARPIFINISRHFERAKKITRIINAATLLKEQGYSFTVLLIGDGEDSKEYERMINENDLTDTVIMLGRKSNPYNYLKNSDYLIVSSDFEGYGIVIDEARVLNVPIISTDVADAKEIVDGKFGVVCSNSDDGIFNAMKKAIENNLQVTESFDYTEFNRKIDDKLNEVLNANVEV